MPGLVPGMFVTAAVSLPGHRPRAATRMALVMIHGGEPQFRKVSRIVKLLGNLLRRPA
jgi:hypothetical protein